ncbi:MULTISPECIES: hypothetical protein [unclassified Curtobacterium]|uniref:hypothetical protein n=1 Tax=unclassified Curtobacterium TaxID=257496 RepID=UPI000DA8FEFD|nr:MULTISPECIES: hypothetical protein [unclassified Curtobacterium]PZE27124.1 hypothetical protein DEI86_06310 [Curtobacterium sp. MCBD17_028]PZE74763.1 hypothetical protein DEI82_10100 [Curtobacterium sp. MCBD17_019]
MRQVLDTPRPCADPFDAGLAGRNASSLERLAALDPRVRTVRSVGDRAADASAIAATVEGDADVVIDALGPTPTADLTMAGFDVVRVDGTMVLLGGVRQTLPVPYGELMRRRITLRGNAHRPVRLYLVRNDRSTDAATRGGPTAADRRA